MKIEILVKTGTSRSNISKEGDIYLVYLRSEPKNNSANIELINLLSNYFEISKTSITILKGLRSKYKLVEIESSENSDKEKRP